MEAGLSPDQGIAGCLGLGRAAFGSHSLRSGFLASAAARGTSFLMEENEERLPEAAADERTLSP